MTGDYPDDLVVSTHSHPKVAAQGNYKPGNFERGFNTQPPEGGCYPLDTGGKTYQLFQHTATRRWLPNYGGMLAAYVDVSTHSHPKVAAHEYPGRDKPYVVSTHSHPKVAAMWRRMPSCTSWFQHTATRRWLPEKVRRLQRRRGFNTQPPEGGCILYKYQLYKFYSFNTQPPEGGCGS